MTHQYFRYIILKDGICYDNDDYELFGAVLFDVVDNKIVSTKYGHGVDMIERNESINIDEAINENLINIADIISVIINDLKIGFAGIDLTIFGTQHNLDNPTNIPVKIIGGRKSKGIEGRLIYVKKIPCRYGWGVYHNCYDYHPVIANLETDELIEINSVDYITVPTWFIIDYNKNLINNIGNTISTLKSLAHIYAYKMSYSRFDSQRYREEINKYSSIALSLFNPSDDITNIIKKHTLGVEIEKKIKVDLLKDKHMSNIIEWVKKNTNKKGDDILKLAEHIFNKKYM